MHRAWSTYLDPTQRLEGGGERPSLDEYVENAVSEIGVGIFETSLNF
jgi:hypothetical protein